MHTIKCYIKDELKEHENNIKERGGIASSVLERVHLLTDTYKNILKIEKYDPEFYDDYQPKHQPKHHSYSPDEVKSLMEKLYKEVDHAEDKAAILKAMREV